MDGAVHVSVLGQRLGRGCRGWGWFLSPSLAAWGWVGIISSAGPVRTGKLAGPWAGQDGDPVALAAGVGVAPLLSGGWWVADADPGTVGRQSTQEDLQPVLAKLLVDYSIQSSLTM